MKKLLFLISLFFTFSVFSQTVAKRTAEFNLEKKVAIQGYDPVSYFKGKPTKGKKEISIIDQGVVYNFSSQTNKDAFTKSPSSYEPQYGGWCAFAMGNSAEKVDVNPETFKIIDGKLYLFYNAYFNNTLKSWNKDEGNLKKKADANWHKIVN